MNMGIARLANVSSRSISDGQVVALRSAWWVRDIAQMPSGRSVIREPAQKVPMLDWPADLFADEIVSH
jgi:hypothetical protein